MRSAEQTEWNSIKMICEFKGDETWMNSSISREEFDVLVALSGGTAAEELVERLPYSPGTVHNTLKGLTENGYIEAGRVTPQGLEALEPYRAKRAVFIAAGFGMRLAPVTLNTPKPLVRVHGKRIIDGLIDACLQAGITEIYIVRGYLAEQFDQLLYKYPMIRFLENPVYNEANNISSAMCARGLLANAYVFEADLLISNPGIITKYHYTSDFLAIWKERTDDWCFEAENGIISVEKVGGRRCWQMVGISYWDEVDGMKLFNHIKEAYEMPGGKERYWEQVPLTVFQGQYRVAIRECCDTDIVEIDTFQELKAVDKAYTLNEEVQREGK